MDRDISIRESHIVMIVIERFRISPSNTEVHKAVVMDLQRIQRITNNQILYNVGFRGTVTGDPLSQIIQTLFRISMPYSYGMTHLDR